MEMESVLFGGTIAALRSEDAKRFRDILKAAGYTESRLNETLGTSVPTPAHHEQSRLITELAEGGSPFHLLARLFFLGTSVENDEVEAVLPNWFIRTCVDCGLLLIEGTSFRPVALVVPVGNVYLASDLHLTVSQDDGSYVPTVSQPALHMRSLAIGKPMGRMLDLCGGFALHGILSSRYCDQVVTTDLNPRAREFAAFNAALNGCENVKAVTGNLFQAVQGEQFDLILSNPPFVISPEDLATFRDSPYELDGFVQQMLAEAPGFLTEGGVLQTICEWVEFEGQDWQERLTGWFQGNGCDAWILTANRQLPSTYARGRLRETTSDETELAARQDQWEQAFRDRNVKAIHGGFIFLRRRQGSNWFDVTQIAKAVDRPIGDAISQGFENRDLVFRKDNDQALLESRLSVANGLRQVANSHWEDHSWHPDSITLHLDKGLPVTIGVDDQIRSLIETFNGGTVRRASPPKIRPTNRNPRRIGPHTGASNGASHDHQRGLGPLATIASPRSSSQGLIGSFGISGPARESSTHWHSTPARSSSAHAT